MSTVAITPLRARAGAAHRLLGSSQCRWVSAAPSSPRLRILFAGSDHFSATHLKALHREAVSNPSLIESIDVLCRVGRRTGRLRNVIKEVPVKDVANSLHLPIHEINRFQDWDLPPKPINLIIAVSFGLFIPSRILSGVEYGGINVHPSLLPMYRGPAPLYHTLLDQAPITGVTVQTLHHKIFDHGDILLQTHPPIPVPSMTSYSDLHDTLALHGAGMLLETLRRRLFVPPINVIKSPYEASDAPKINKANTYVDWTIRTAEDVERLAGVLEVLWTRMASVENPQMDRKPRVILTNLAPLPDFNPEADLPPGGFKYVKDGRDEILAVRCKEGWIRVGGIKMENRRLIDGGEWVRSLQGRGEGKIFC